MRLRRRHARWLATGLAALATLLALEVLAPAPPQGSPVVVTTRAIEAGQTLQSGDLALVDYPHTLAPDGAITRPEEAVGRRLTGGADAGEALTVTRLRGGAAVPAGHVALSVTLPASSTHWITAGAPVVILRDGAQWEGVVLDAGGEADGGAGLGAVGTGNTSVLVAVRSRIANEIAGSGGADSLFLALRP